MHNILFQFKNLNSSNHFVIRKSFGTILLVLSTKFFAKHVSLLYQYQMPSCYSGSKNLSLYSLSWVEDPEDLTNN